MCHRRTSGVHVRFRRVRAAVVGTLELAACLAVIFVAAMPCAYGMSGTDHVVTRGQTVQGLQATSVTTRSEDGTAVTIPVEPWPEGTLDLVNDPLRTDGWLRWFTECPNDREDFDFVVRSVADVNHLIERLAAIKTDSVRVMLSVSEASTPNDKPDANAPSAFFSIGNQSLVNIWFSGLRRDDTGARVFGVNRYTKPPDACPPTLILLVERDTVDLAKIKVPVRVEVVTNVSKPYRAAHEGSTTLKSIDQFIEEHAAKRKANDEGPPKTP